MNSKKIFVTTCIYAPFGNEKDNIEFKLTFNGEVLDSKMVSPIISQALIEGAVCCDMLVLCCPLACDSQVLLPLDTKPLYRIGYTSI